ncbi:hypothetical protein LJ754_16350 [Arthrobacter sp. zg-Y40]|uniref:hypothetical protein n=1 Tax=Arthrobacter sp. zg-Y40 TaxID=2886939 RepID=UPI001D13D177|nr:hypothetical protein [Arthrobacter sp. zg-Y40]MCC3280718.1 hypothetical protein [Arthrobacter sp. zg-Y40]
MEVTCALLGESFTTVTAAHLTRELVAAAGRPELVTGNLGGTRPTPDAHQDKPLQMPAGRGRPAAAGLPDNEGPAPTFGTGPFA